MNGAARVAADPLSCFGTRRPAAVGNVGECASI
jgi:hypothetical protein